MQSGGNSFCGYVVFDSDNMTSRDEDSLLDQIYEKKIRSDFYYDDFNIL